MRVLSGFAAVGADLPLNGLQLPGGIPGELEQGVSGVR
ncbi:hypothetical protein SAMN05421874_11455 [Nonomuraea maritima]|uniref:Uncharacterized protein n=1 Tax=Nonomuraea maritima TaxID=683260 RepID=A0A1G9GGE1_9ACTN|nr:hypothetical protein SAMN05421874_11455 [Nonomuraea maritima]